MLCVASGLFLFHIMAVERTEFFSFSLCWLVWSEWSEKVFSRDALIALFCGFGSPKLQPSNPKSNLARQTTIQSD
jgi:hypothetical protein